MTRCCEGAIRKGETFGAPVGGVGRAAPNSPPPFDLLERLIPEEMAEKRGAVRADHRMFGREREFRRVTSFISDPLA